MLVDGFRATTQACGYGSRLKAGTTVFFAATSSLRLARNDDVIGDITPDVIDRDRRSRDDRAHDGAGAFALIVKRRYQGSPPWIAATC
jgi:hypothetical protein